MASRNRQLTGLLRLSQSQLYNGGFQPTEIDGIASFALCSLLFRSISPLFHRSPLHTNSNPTQLQKLMHLILNPHQCANKVSEIKLFPYRVGIGISSENSAPSTLSLVSPVRTPWLRFQECPVPSSLSLYFRLCYPYFRILGWLSSVGHITS